MDKKTTGIIAYITLIGWFIAYFVGDNEGAKFHLNQALTIIIAQLVCGAVVGIGSKIPLLGIIVTLAGSLASLLLFVFWIMGLINAINEEEKPLPIIGGIVLLK